MVPVLPNPEPITDSDILVLPQLCWQRMILHELGHEPLLAEVDRGLYDSVDSIAGFGAPFYSDFSQLPHARRNSARAE